MPPRRRSLPSATRCRRTTRRGSTARWRTPATTTTRTTRPSCMRAYRSCRQRLPPPSCAAVRTARTSSPASPPVWRRSAGSAWQPASASSKAASSTPRCSATSPQPSRRDACSGSTSRRWSTRSASPIRRLPATTRSHATAHSRSACNRDSPRRRHSLSVQLAQRNVRGAQATFEGIDGFLRVYLRERCDRDALRDRLGEHYEFTQLSYKPYPCCRFNHAAIDAALALRSSAGIRAGDVRRVRVGVNRQAYEAVCTPVEVRKAPRTIVHAQFSIPYTVATALTDGCVRLGHFAEASLHREEILVARAAGGSVRRSGDRARMESQHLARPPARRHGGRDRARRAGRLAARSSTPSHVGRGFRRQGRRLLSRRRAPLSLTTRRVDCATSSTGSSRSTTSARSRASWILHRDRARQGRRGTTSGSIPTHRQRRQRPHCHPWRRRNAILETRDSPGPARRVCGRRRGSLASRGCERAGRVAQPTHQAGRAVRARRQQRHHRARAGDEARSATRPAGGRREQGRRRRDHRHRRRGQVATGRLHPAVRLDLAHDQRGERQESPLRRAEGPATDRRGGRRAVRGRRVQRLQGNDAARIHRHRAREAEQHQLRQRRRRRHQPPRHRTARLGGQDPARARAVQGHRSRVHRPHGGQAADGAADASPRRRSTSTRARCAASR